VSRTRHKLYLRKSFVRRAVIDPEWLGSLLKNPGSVQESNGKDIQQRIRELFTRNNMDDIDLDTLRSVCEDFNIYEFNFESKVFYYSLLPDDELNNDFEVSLFGRRSRDEMDTWTILSGVSYAKLLTQERKLRLLRLFGRDDLAMILEGVILSFF
jgi:hypothetical protein